MVKRCPYRSWLRSARTGRGKEAPVQAVVKRRPYRSWLRGARTGRLSTGPKGVGHPHPYPRQEVKKLVGLDRSGNR